MNMDQPDRSRSPDRSLDREVLRSIFSVYGLKGLTAVVSLASVPLAAGHLGLERYGLWLAISSLIGILGLCDLGLGSNLTTLLAQAIGRGDHAAASRHVWATFWSVAVAALAVLMLSVALHPVVPWPSVFNFSEATNSEELSAVALLIGAIASMQLLAGLCQRIYAGLQRSYVGSAWQAAGVIGSFFALLLAIRLGGGLGWLVVALGLVPVVIQLIGLAWILQDGKFGQLQMPGSLSKSDYRLVVHGSAMMFLVALQSVFWLSKDSLLIAHAISLDEVGRYNTAFRIYMLVFGFLVGSLGALWPAYAQAYARADRHWMRRTLGRSALVAIGGMAVFGLVFTVAGEVLLTWYVGKELAASRPLLIALGIYFVVLAAVNVLSFFLMGTGQVKVIAWGGLAGGILSVPLGMYGMQHYGLMGLTASNLVCLMVPVLGPLLVVVNEHDALSWKH